MSERKCCCTVCLLAEASSSPVPVGLSIHARSLLPRLLAAGLAAALIVCAGGIRSGCVGGFLSSKGSDRPPASDVSEKEKEAGPTMIQSKSFWFACGACGLQP